MKSPERAKAPQAKDDHGGNGGEDLNEATVCDLARAFKREMKEMLAAAARLLANETV